MKPRMLSEMREMFLDHADGERELYLMHRGVYRKREERLCAQAAKLSYDITEIFPGTVGREFIKTKGHYHPTVPGTMFGYPEIYQVLEGEATYIMQRPDEGKVDDVIIIKAAKGDIVMVPPGYGHVTVNSGKAKLRMANWVSDAFRSEYGEYERLKGAAYLLLSDGSLIRNRLYAHLPKARHVDTPSFRKLFCVSDMYELVGDLDILEFLNRPDRHPELFRWARLR